nr:MAG TPA: hypothetical protein [Caudoviricetes sp.]
MSHPKSITPVFFLTRACFIGLFDLLSYLISLC